MCINLCALEIPLVVAADFQSFVIYFDRKQWILRMESHSNSCFLSLWFLCEPLVTGEVVVIAVYHEIIVCAVNQCFTYSSCKNDVLFKSQFTSHICKVHTIVNDFPTDLLYLYWFTWYFLSNSHPKVHFSFPWFLVYWKEVHCGRSGDAQLVKLLGHI